MATDDSAPPERQGSLTLPALFLRFLGFGCRAFGGPVAQIAMLREALVEDEHWVSPARFNRLLAILQVLPGPEAHELCVHLGMVARGRIGGLLAGLGFMLPGLLLMLLAGWLYVTWVAPSGGFTGVLLAVQIVVIAIIVRAVVRIGQHVVTNRLLQGIAFAALVATLLGMPFWLVLAAGALAYAVPPRWVPAIVLAALAAAWAVYANIAPTMAPATPAGLAIPVTLTGLFVAGLKGGLLTFGGAYTAIPYVRADTVGRGWIADATFLDGIALAGVLPAPLVIFATFVGYIAGGPLGALVITFGMFLPAFAFSMVFFERLEAVVENAALHRLLEGVAAAVVGIIAATCIQLAVAIGGRVTVWPVAVALFATALVVALRVKGAWTTPGLIGAGALCGWLMAP